MIHLHCLNGERATTISTMAIILVEYFLPQSLAYLFSCHLYWNSVFPYESGIVYHKLLSERLSMPNIYNEYQCLPPLIVNVSTIAHNMERYNRNTNRINLTTIPILIQTMLSPLKFLDFYLQ